MSRHEFPGNSRIRFDTALHMMLSDRADNCLVCGRERDPHVELPLVAQWSCGVALDYKVVNDFDRRHDYFGYRKVLDIPEAWLSVWGSGPLWNEAVLDKAEQLVLRGKRPWYCYRCGEHYCVECGSLFDIPYQADYLDHERLVFSTFHLKQGRYRCYNHECRLFTVTPDLTGPTVAQLFGR